MTPNTQDRGKPRLSIRFAIQLLTLCFVLFAVRGAWAQANAGITGTVTDASGAVIPDANVTITNEGTSVSTTAVTTGSRPPCDTAGSAVRSRRRITGP